jgi:sec-independent protein translocase protein TatC
MAKVLRPIGYEDRLSIVDHLGELRSRLFVCLAVLAVAFAFCYWQNNALLNLLNRALPQTAQSGSNKIGGLTRDNANASKDLARSAQAFQVLSGSPDLSAPDRALIARAASSLQSASKALPQKDPKNIPVTLGVGEGFTTTLTVCFYAAILLTLPILLYEIYAFVVPALSDTERRVARPVVLAAPALFVAGVVFTYFIVLPAAVKFLQGYNAGQFDNLVQAKPLYSFQVLTMGSIGLAFQLPLMLLGLRQLGVINGSTLTRHWRYATVIIAVIAAAMPGADPVTTGLETAPLVILFLVSIVLLKLADRRDAKRAAAELITVGPPDAGESD